MIRFSSILFPAPSALWDLISAPSLIILFFCSHFFFFMFQIITFLSMCNYRLKFILRRLNTSQGTDYHLHFKPCCMAPLTQWSVKHVWSESEDCLPFLQLAQDYISSCGKKTLHEILEKVFKSFRPLLGLPDVDDDAFEEYNADVEEEEPEADHQQMGVSQQ
ncbi:PREDICTED: maturin isoform X1 [Corvus brachyrhynchos]|uniref:maturin isoform X1 n=1 Tax=Corvus brachyrhynchos TaxID=85066 RepID=UPI0008167B01|nr:PREDICTED: maturin isoform X1 [Corvus brachyrhynchos]